MSTTETPADKRTEAQPPADYEAIPRKWTLRGTTATSGRLGEDQQTAYLVAASIDGDTVRLRYATAYGEHAAIVREYDTSRVQALVAGGRAPLVYIIDHDNPRDAGDVEQRTAWDRRMLRELYPGLGLRDRSGEEVA